MAPRRKRQLPINEMSARHPGLTDVVAADYHEAVRVCLDRHHASPTDFEVMNEDDTSAAEVAWEKTDERERSARASYRETTERAAYGCALAATELTDGLVAIGRADVPSGADYYVAPAGSRIDDLERALRLEVSGIDVGGSAEIRRRLKTKLDQAVRGKSNLPAIAGIVCFKAKMIVLKRVEAT